jgi:hypothetical protein
MQENHKNINKNNRIIGHLTYVIYREKNQIIDYIGNFSKTSMKSG